MYVNTSEIFMLTSFALLVQLWGHLEHVILLKHFTTNGSFANQILRHLDPSTRHLLSQCHCAAHQKCLYISAKSGFHLINLLYR